MLTNDLFDVTAPEAFNLGLKQGRELERRKIDEEISNIKESEYLRGYEDCYNKVINDCIKEERYKNSEKYQRDIEIYRELTIRGMTFYEVADKYNLTESRISQIYNKVKEQIKNGKVR